MDYVNGYLPYQKCVGKVTILNNFEARLHITEYDFEGMADTLILNYGNSQSRPIEWQAQKVPNYYILTADVKNAELIFTSDGNTQGAGYTAYLDTYECNCSDSNFFIKCGRGVTLTPMNALSKSSQYCSNMNCNYTIIANSSCPNSYFSINFFNFMRDSIDYLLLNDNGVMVQNITSATATDINRYYSSKNNVTLQFHSGPSSDAVTDETKAWAASITTLPLPNFINVSLNGTNPKYVVWLNDMSQNDALTVCAGAGILEMFVSFTHSKYDLSNVLLYDGSDLINFVGR
uniref:CUB domain-containing protein n=1 Tax=Panagrolaimus sp. PS1159 TaxID=55785 RepID=A0AC35ERX5_9BILA